MEHCSGCNKSFEEVSLVKCVISGNGFYKYCNKCSQPSGASIPDVWYGYGSGEHSEENIAYPKGHPRQGQPIPFFDKRSKKAAMEQAGIREAGDRKHGARNESNAGKKKYFL